MIHTAVFLWIVAAPGEKPFDPARADPVIVDLVSPKDVPQLAEPAPAKPEMASPPALEPPKAAPVKPASVKPAPVKPAPLTSARRTAEAPKPEPPKPVREADLKPTPQPAPKIATAPSVENEAAAARRVAWMLDLYAASLPSSGGGLPSDTGATLTSDEIAKLKARVSQCWVGPDAPAALDNVLIRVQLNPNGALRAEPEPRALPQFPSDPLLVIRLVESATRALQQCQPYDFLPADRYQDWKDLELGFSVAGPSDLHIPALDGSLTR
jgi:outer membrane biosynthesis protein TonB